MAEDPSPEVAKILQRLDALEHRLARLETGQQERAAAPMPQPSFKPAPRQPSPTLVPHPDESKSSPTEPEEILTVLPVDPPTLPAPAESALVLPELAARKPWSLRAETAVPPAFSKSDFEQMIGLKWAGWIGAIVLVIGVGLGIKFAYDQGWFGDLPVRLRLFLMSLGGFALLAAGEVVYRRINRISAAGPFGAGIAVLFVVSYAGNVYYAAYDYQTAFVFALATTIIGSAVAMRGRLVSIAVLAQIGGHLAPIILSTGQPPGVALLAYVLMLQIVALVLAMWGQTPKWWILRAVSLAPTAWWVVVCLDLGHWSAGLANEVLWFTFVYAAAYQGELLRSALLAAETKEQRTQVLPAGFGSVFSLLVTAGLMAVVLYVFYDYDSRLLRGGSTLTLAVLTLGGGLLLRSPENSLVDALKISYRLQGIVLIVLFVPVTLTGVWISLAWGVLSLAFAVLAARFDRPLVRGAALGTWLLALIRLVIDIAAAEHGGEAGQIWLQLLGQPIKGYTILAWLLAAAGLGLGWLTQARLPLRKETATADWLVLGSGAAILASLVWLIASLAGLPPLGATFALLLWAWVVVGLDFVTNRLELSLHALVILCLAAIKWVLVDTLKQRLLSSWHALNHFPVFNPRMAVGALLAVSLGAILWLRRSKLAELLTKCGLSRPPARFWAAAIFAQAFILLTVGLSFEVDRLVERGAAAGHDLVWPIDQLKLFGLTLLWLTAALVLAASGRRLEFPAVVPWALMLTVAGKFLLFDMLVARFAMGGAPASVLVLLNFQVFTAVSVLAGMHGLRYLARPKSENDLPVHRLMWAARVLSLLIMLVAVSLEIDRAFASSLAAGLSDPQLAKQVAISIFWSLFAVVTVGAGFRFRTDWLRFFGLGLFGVTLLKVGLLDLSQVEFGYRILSLLGLGLLLLATSVLYGRLSPKLLGEAEPERAEQTR